MDQVKQDIGPGAEDKMEMVIERDYLICSRRDKDPREEMDC